MTQAPPPRIGIDTGGTFTDVVTLGRGARRAWKVPSTPDDPARAVFDALDAVGGLPTGGRLHHGSTVGTNAVLTGEGARVVLVVTEGFQDVLRLARGVRDDLHALRPRREPPLLERSMVVGVRERTGADGRAIEKLGREAIDRAIRAVERRRPDSIAVCLLHAVRAPAHEERLVKALRRAFAAKGIRIHASAEISADAREAERAATTVLDAFIGPKVAAYVDRIADDLPPDALTVMRSDGGRMSADEVRRAPVRTLLSGPAAGVTAAHGVARALGLDRALSFDMGGTSTDVAWLEGQHLSVENELVVGAHRASVPSLAMETVGAGGGSRVWLDAGGALRVGPASAGATPGPACYGHGGPLTLTDVWLVLGRLPDALLDGAFALDAAAAHREAETLARQAGVSVRALAEGAVDVAAATTARALRRASVAQGHDPRGADLIVFGGAGPMLGAETADLLELRSIVVPVDPGTLAAMGTLVAPLAADASRALGAQDASSLPRLRKELEQDVRERLHAQGARSVAMRAEIDARYAGQAFEVTVPWGRAWAKAFHTRHAARFGFADDARPIELVRLRVRGQGQEASRRAPKRRARSRSRGARLHARGGRVLKLRRAELDLGTEVVGPALFGEMSATTYVPAGWRAGLQPTGEIVLERRAAR